MFNPKPRCPALVAVATTKSFLDAPDGGCIGLTSMRGASVTSAPNVVSARVATKATFLLLRPTIMTTDVVPRSKNSSERIIHAETMAVATPNWGICPSVGAVQYRANPGHTRCVRSRGTRASTFCRATYATPMRSPTMPAPDFCERE